MRAYRIDSMAAQFLISTCQKRDRRFLRTVWYRLDWAFQRRARTVQIKIHGRDVLANFGYTYPYNSRLFPNLNAPLLDLVAGCYRAKRRPIRLVDVGAAIGDTVLLVESNCPGMVAEYVCVDGDPVFFKYLENNLSFLSNVKLVQTQLGSGKGSAPSLVRTHAGTASAQGKQQVQINPLDGVIQTYGIGPVDVLKIDVDGFDGEVLAGASQILQRDRPKVIFEWHPILCAQTGNDWRSGFDALVSAGYTSFLWFDKFGNFSRSDSAVNLQVLETQARYCMSMPEEDRHYDVIALHPDSQMLIDQLTSGEFSRGRVSRF